MNDKLHGHDELVVRIVTVHKTRGRSLNETLAKIEYAGRVHGFTDSELQYIRKKIVKEW